MKIWFQTDIFSLQDKFRSKEEYETGAAIEAQSKLAAFLFRPNQSHKALYALQDPTKPFNWFPVLQEGGGKDDMH